MSYRLLFREIMHYGSFDRMPVIHWDIWPETRQRWLKEGWPEEGDIHRFLGTVPLWASLVEPDSWLGVGSEKDIVNLGLYPPFEPQTLEETAEYRVYRSADGVICKAWKSRSGIPQYIGHTLKDAAGWEQFKRRLQPDERRLAPDLLARLAALDRGDLPVCFPAASLMGWIRNWMGVENMSYLMYDDRDTYRDMVMTIADLVCWAADRILPHLKADLAHSWEDISGKSGPLVSPAVFDECVAPGYRKIRGKLEEYGVGLYSVDSDGNIADLIGHWLEAGVNLLFPLEVGSFQGDARRYRRRFGRSLRLVGNFDKLALEKGRRHVETELERLTPLMDEGGYIVMPDHIITPGAALEDYRWYLDRVRGIRLR